MPIRIVCPFYSSDKELRIRCEGACKDFSKKTEMKSYIRQYCANMQGWEHCDIAVLINKKYEHMCVEGGIKLNREQKRELERKDLAYELGRYKKKVEDMSREMSTLKARTDILKAQVQAANAFIATIAAKQIGDDIPADGEIIIPKATLTAVIKSQHVSWHEDKKANTIVIQLRKKETEKVQ